MGSALIFGYATILLLTIAFVLLSNKPKTRLPVYVTMPGAIMTLLLAAAWGGTTLHGLVGTRDVDYWIDVMLVPIIILVFAATFVRHCRYIVEIRQNNHKKSHKPSK